MKLLVLGSAQHGKDTVCDMLRDIYGLSFVSSSFFCLKKCVRLDLARQGIIYENDEACYADRDNHRDKWFNSIAAYNRDDPSRLGRELLAEYDIYCGLRNALEFEALLDARVFDVALWVDRSAIVDREDHTSFTIPQSVADFVINNNHDLDYLRNEVRRAHHYCSLVMQLGKDYANAQTA